VKIGCLAPHYKGVVSELIQLKWIIGLRKATAYGEVKAMHASVASFNVYFAAIPAGVVVAVNGLNNNANNNTRHNGWAGV
jgi:hypothetical protein